MKEDEEDAICYNCGDIIRDGNRSYFCDSQCRHQFFDKYPTPRIAKMELGRITKLRNKIRKGKL
jgi:hypothetical protein